MSKAVLASIQPKWCELIAIGEKTVEVRKTIPNLQTPFKVYIYCTKGRNETLWKHEGTYYYDTQFPNERPNTANGKVIGEFACERIDLTEKDKIKAISEASCVSIPDLWEYGRKTSAYCLYGWHISDLVIYEKPRDLSEFGLSRPPQSWCYVEETA